MDPRTILNALSNAGLGRLQLDFPKLLQESIRLTLHPLDRSPTLTGVSILGGVPDLPSGMAWPARKNVPMSFIAQVNLEDLVPFEPAQDLPKSGLLSFFYDAAQETNGADPADRGGWQVFYFPPASAAPVHESGFYLFGHGNPHPLKPAAFPARLPSGARFKPCLLTFTSEFTLPGAPSQYLSNLDWTPDEIQRYEQFQASFPTVEDRKSLHFRMFGCPEQIQDDMQLQCALYANGFSSLDALGAAQAVAHKGDWQLLLQVDSDEIIGMRWASYGMLYFWLEKSALQQGQFNRSWLVLQSD
ncbi:MAG: YwqG family protein [Anaerolineaceae bacterium]